MRALTKYRNADDVDKDGNADGAHTPTLTQYLELDMDIDFLALDPPLPTRASSSIHPHLLLLKKKLSPSDLQRKVEAIWNRAAVFLATPSHCSRWPH
jgi:hypothetical protein